MASGFEKLKNYGHVHPSVAIIIFSGFFIFLILFFINTLADLSPRLQNAVMFIMPAKKQKASTPEIDIDKYIGKLKTENRVMEKKLSSVIPYGAYLVVNTTENSFRRYNSGKLKRQGYCSTGSSVLLQADSAQQWIIPLIFKKAIKHTAEAAEQQKNQLLSPLKEDTWFRLYTDRNLNITINQVETVNISGAVSRQRFFRKTRKLERRELVNSMANLKIPEYYSFIKIYLSRSDARILYRALPEHAIMVLRL